MDYGKGTTLDGPGRLWGGKSHTISVLDPEAATQIIFAWNPHTLDSKHLLSPRAKSVILLMVEILHDLI